MAVESSPPDTSGEARERAAPTPSSGFLTVELASSHDLQGFVCERDPGAVRYLQVDMWDHVTKSCGQAYGHLGPDGRQILGFYHLVGSVLQRASFQNADTKKIPKDGPVSVYHLAYIARDDRAPVGLGAALVIDAARRARSLFPTWGMGLHANNARLVAFYESLGFKIIRSLKQELQSTGSFAGSGPFHMYADYASLIVD